MYFTKQTLTALLGMSTLAASAPAVEPRDFLPAERGLKWQTRAEKLTIIQNVNQPPPIIVLQNNNLGEIALLQQQLAEQQLASLVQNQVALVSQLEGIKNNIRLNQFKAQFPQVNVVVVTVQNVVDNRVGQNASTRYLVNQLLVDNGKPDKQIAVMVRDANTMTIGADQLVATPAQATAVPAATAAPVLSNFNPSLPFGQIGQSVILPAGVAAPQVNLIVADPANIILPNQNLFVQDANSFVQQCAQFAQNANSFLLSNIQLFSSFDQLAAAQAAAIIFDSALQNAVGQVQNQNQNQNQNKGNGAKNQKGGVKNQNQKNNSQNQKSEVENQKFQGQSHKFGGQNQNDN